MSRALRPALYYPWVYTMGGAERTILELMARSRHDWTLYTNRFHREATFPEFSSLNVVCLEEVPVRRNIQSVGKAAFTLLTQSLDLTSHNALLVVSEGLGNLIALRSRIPTSCICLTPLKIAYDDVTRRNFFRGRVRLHYRLAIEGYRWLERPIWRRYERVLCNSAEVRRRVLEARLVPEERVEVVHHGVDLERFTPGAHRDRFFLLPGRIMWQKNIDLALSAWRRFKVRESDSDLRMVVAGMVDEKSRPYFAHLRSAAADRRDIEFVASPSDETLIDLYQRSMGVIFTAPNEDWGLVPLEAMACGKPVVAVNRGGPLESVVDGETGFLVADSPDDFAAAIEKISTLSISDLEAVANRTRARASAFGWSQFVERVDDHVEEIGFRPQADRHAGIEVAPAAVK